MAGNKPGRSGEKVAKGGAKESSPSAKAPTTRGRVTPKGSTTSGRYTPPIPREQKVSPRWVPVLMFACLGLGMAVIVLNYLSLLPGAPSNMYLLAGLVLITIGFVTATQFH